MKQDLIKILFIGDIVGRPGRRAACYFVNEIKKKEGIDLVVANGENLAAGKGMTYEKYQEMKDCCIDYFTSGNHIWNNPDFVSCLDDPKVNVLRPANYADSLPGRGFAKIKVNGHNVVIINLQGRVFMRDAIEDPFIIGKNIVDENNDSITIIDFHAEATSEKVALGYYLDGRVTAILGTHTHIQTADEKILPKGTAYISDVGMCGPEDSVLGVKKEIIIEKFLTQLPKSHKIATGDSIFNAVLLEIDTKNKKAISIRRYLKLLKN